MSTLRGKNNKKVKGLRSDGGIPLWLDQMLFVLGLRGESKEQNLGTGYSYERICDFPPLSILP